MYACKKVFVTNQTIQRENPFEYCQKLALNMRRIMRRVKRPKSIDGHRLKPRIRNVCEKGICSQYKNILSWNLCKSLLPPYTHTETPPHTLTCTDWDFRNFVNGHRFNRRIRHACEKKTFVAIHKVG